jgi:nucleoside 2-deoxyribosyltransferase
MKKVYFACSITGGRDHAHVYEDIVAIIKANGVRVLSEMFAAKGMLPTEGPTPELTDKETWERDMNMVKEADAIIAEVTTQ